MEDLRSWEELSDLERAACTYWDMYKDAHGVRPRGIDTSSWTLADFDKEFEYLGNVIQQEEALRKEEEAAAVIRFSKLVEDTIAAGAADRETALRWIMDASNCLGDWEFLCYEHGLPYRYFKQAA